jgi:hypothetical protein
MLAEPPSNGGYLAAAYIVTAAILTGYWRRLWRMGKRVSGNSKSVSGKRKA